MGDTKNRNRVIFIGPGRQSQGGISAVIGNYRNTSFWQEFNCIHFASTSDFGFNLAKMFYGSWRLFVFVGLLLLSRRPYAISIHTSHSGSFYRKLAYLVIAKVFRVPAVLHVHPAAFARFYDEGSKLRKNAIRLAGRLSDQIIFLSNQTMSDFTGLFPSNKLGVLGNPVDIQLFSSARESEESQRFRVLFLGWIVREKGVYDLVDAIPAVLESFPEVVFTFAGNKEVDKLKNLISSRGLNRSTEVVGWITGQAKTELLGSSTILVLPSYTEGLPNVILEAMASELPIVTTPVGGIPDVLAHDQTAIFVEPGNIHSIANGINKLLGDKRKRDRLAKAAFTRACRLYSLEVIGGGLAGIYDRYRPATRPQILDKEGS